MASLTEIFADPVEFASRLQIQLRDLSRIRFSKIITEAQIEVIEALSTHRRVAITKGRQLGVTTACRAWAIWKAVTTPRFNAGLVSNKMGSTKEISRMDKLFLDTLSDVFQVKLIASANQKEVVLKNGSRLLYFSGAATNDRGYTLNALHCTEYAHIRDAGDLLGSLLQSVPRDGYVVVESTPSHYGDSLHAINESGGVWHNLFLPWYTFQEYTLPLPDDWAMTAEERILNEKGISQPALAWRRYKIDEFSGDVGKFRREFPISANEAYSLAEGAWLDERTLSNVHAELYSETWEGAIGKGIRVQTLRPVDSGHHYVIGYDPAGGGGGDYSVAVVLDRHTRDVVQVISSNRTTIQDFSDRVGIASGYWMNAKIQVELNNHGLRAYNSMTIGVQNRTTKFLTTAKTKVEVLEILRQAIHTDLLGTVDLDTAGELRTMAKQPNGHAPAATVGKHDDRVMALCFALQLNSKLPAIIAATHPPAQQVQWQG